MTKPNEYEFMPLRGYEGVYEINRMAQIRRCGIARGAKVGLILKNQKCGRYLGIRLFSNNIGRSHMVHTLMAETFLGGVPDGMNVCHNNGIGTDCALSNLRVDTPRGNEADKVAHGKDPRGERHGMARITETDALLIRTLVAQGETHALVAARYGVCRQTVGDIVSRRRWRHI